MWCSDGNIYTLYHLQEEAMSEVRAEAKESRRERRLQQDKLATTRFDTGVRNEWYCKPRVFTLTIWTDGHLFAFVELLVTSSK